MMRSQARPRDPELVSALEDHIPPESEPEPIPMPAEPPESTPETRGGRRCRAAKLAATDGWTIFKASYPDPVFLIDGMLTTGATLFCGRPKIGKSWFTLQMALAVAGGGPFLGRYPVSHTGRVTYLGLEESSARTHRRLRQLVPKPDITLQNIGFIYSLEPLLAGGAAQLDEYLAVNPSALVVVDSLLSILQASGKRDVLRSDYQEVNMLRELAEKHGAALVVVHHSRKLAADYHIDSVAGTSGVTAACDAVWSLKRKSEGDALLELSGREQEEKSIGLKFDTGVPFGWRGTGEGVEATMSEERRDILDLLKEDAPMSPAGIATALGKNRITIRRLLSLLAADGLIVKGIDRKYRLSSFAP